MLRPSWCRCVLVFCVVVAVAADAALAQLEPERIEIAGADSVRIYGFWYARDMTSDTPVALLLHNPGASHAHWRPLLQPLRDAGFRVLAIDFRGHGDSKDLTPEIYAQISRREVQPYADMIYDVEAAVQWLTKVQKLPPARIALVGGEHAANLALQAMARNRKLAAAVAMSPSRAYFNFPLVETAKKIGSRPLLVLVPKQILNEGASQMQEAHRNNPGFELKIYPKYEHHGVHMLGLNWKVEETIAEWLARVYGTKP